jgi:hypothetical protein
VREFPELVVFISRGEGPELLLKDCVIGRYIGCPHVLRIIGVFDLLLRPSNIRGVYIMWPRLV